MRQSYFNNLLDRTFHAKNNWWDKYHNVIGIPLLELTTQQKENLLAYRALFHSFAQDKQTPFRQTMMQKVLKENTRHLLLELGTFSPVRVRSCRTDKKPPASLRPDGYKKMVHRLRLLHQCLAAAPSFAYLFAYAPIRHTCGIKHDRFEFGEINLAVSQN